MQFWVGQLKEIRTLSGSDRIQGNKTRTHESTTVRIQSRSAALFSTEHCQVSGRIQIRNTVFNQVKVSGRIQISSTVFNQAQASQRADPDPQHCFQPSTIKPASGSRFAALFSTEQCQVSGRIQIRGTVFKPSTIKSTGRALSVRGRLAVLASQQARKALRLLT